MNTVRFVRIALGGGSWLCPDHRFASNELLARVFQTVIFEVELFECLKRLSHDCTVYSREFSKLSRTTFRTTINEVTQSFGYREPRE